MCPSFEIFVHYRKANVFTVKSNVEASESIVFTLTYEELLQRRFDVYEQAIHIDSDEVKGADSYGVIVTVSDTQDIKMLRAIGREEEDDNDEGKLVAGFEPLQLP